MCLLVLAFKAHPDYPLVLIGNRDEFHQRPALPAHWWNTRRLLAGRDQTAGGTWLGVTDSGRLATVTNYRDPESKRDNAPSRGQLVVEALGRDNESMAEMLVRTGSDYNGFNLLWGSRDGMRYAHNQGKAVIRSLEPGTYGLSNGLLNTPWPKLVRARTALSEIIVRHGKLSSKLLFPILEDRQVPPDHALPDTGIDRNWERLLSTAFIRSSQYGTRASTVVIVDRDGLTTFHERTFDADGLMCTDRAYRFQIAG
ncbi:MAG: NRDE family protein [Aquisalimonadaceae bacterium]